MKTKSRPDGFRFTEYLLFAAVTLAAVLLCVCLGSANIPLKDTFTAIWNTVFGLPVPEGISQSVIVFVRLPRVLATALVGAILSLCGGAVQGLLRNPLADTSTLGVSQGAAVGAVISIAFGLTIPGLPEAGAMGTAIVFAFLSLMIILSLSYKLDYSLSTNTIILVGIIYSMFAGSVISLAVTFAGDKIHSVLHWMMGSLNGSTYKDVLTLLVTLVVFGAVILSFARELNAFAIGEDNARHIGVNVKRVKYMILIAVSVMIGISVSVSGSIGFVGLVIPHMTRMVVGPNHRRLLPACLFSGAAFLMLADLLARTLLSPRELPIGVVTSFVGAFAFIYIFYQSRKAT